MTRCGKVDFAQPRSMAGAQVPLLISLSFDSKNGYVSRAGWLRTALMQLLEQCTTKQGEATEFFWCGVRRDGFGLLAVSFRRDLS